MVVVITRITVAEAATVINAAIIVIQYTLALALVIILGYTIRRRLSTNTPMAWSVITRILQSSLWPTLLRTDSAASSNASVSLFSNLFLLTGILIALAGVITPLGLKDGPLVQLRHSFKQSSYIPDISPIGLATSPREGYEYSRICGSIGPMPCPGNGDNGNTSQIAPSIINIFSSTSHSPFRMQFRRYYKGVGGYNYPMLLSLLTTTQSLILREGIFAIESLIVDLTEHPGIGFWNHTFPTVPQGGTWSTEVLWLEPVSSCVNTNLTIDYKLMGRPNSATEVNLTDRGGFVDLSYNYPTLNRSGQHISIYEHAYKGAALSNMYTMLSFNLTARNESYINRTFPLDTFPAGYFQHLGMGYLPHTTFNDSNIDTGCKGYGGGDVANITNVGVHCGMVLGPPRRTDGGDPRIPGDNSTWTQSLHACASVTRASIQKVDFSFNGTLDLSALRISRQTTNTSVLWAVENTVLNISDIDLFWGRVADSYEDDPSLTTIRSQFFYLPAGAMDIFELGFGLGQPTTMPALAWNKVYSSVSDPYSETEDYTGRHNFALTNKFRTLIEADPFLGPAQIHNLIWTDLVANNLVGSDTNATLLVAENEPSVSYDLRYGIPAALLLVLWLPVFLAATFMLLTGTLNFSYMRYLLNHTSVGRIVVGGSALHVVNGPSPEPNAATLLESGSSLKEEMPTTPSTPAEMLSTADFAKTTGSTLVALKSAELGSSPGNKGDPHPRQSRRSSSELANNEGGGEQNFPPLDIPTTFR